jgi:hypothetical protein
MKLIIFFLLGLLNGVQNQQSNDSVYYAKVTNARNFFDQDRITVTEIWSTKDKFCTLINQRKTVFRNDLGLIYSINLQSKNYRIDSIKSRPTKVPTKNELDFKYIGQDIYNPEFEWREPLYMNKDTVGKYPCDHFSCKGDADFDQISLDYYVVKTDDKTLAGMVNSFLLSSGGSANKREPLIEATNKNKNLLILRIIERVENSIASPITTKITVDTYSKILRNEGLFEIPANFKKIN